MNPDQLYQHLKKLASTLTGGQVVGLLAVFVAVVGVVAGSAYWLSIPQFTLLVSDMDAETSSSVVSTLQNSGVRYELADGGRTIRVPQERVDELRLQLASTGLPSRGRIGFEIFDRTTLGTTEFTEHVNYGRALEGELARTIETLSEVAGARVHITQARKTLFLDKEEPAKASVVLRLRANRPLEPAAARSIASLVAGSVEALKPDAVMILDTSGRSLTKPERDADAGGVHLDKQQQVERAAAAKVLEILEPVVGPGRVRVNVSAELGADIVEETEESYDPASVVRSRQTSQETGAGAQSAGGVAGARANQPTSLSTSTANPATDPAAPPAPSTPVPGVTPPGRSSETTNYEVSRRTVHTVRPQGQLARLSVAVIVDDEHVVTTAGDGTTSASTKPWEAGAIDRFQKLAAAAVGLQPDRGDVLTVENIGFEVPEAAPEVPEAGLGGQLLDGARRYWPTALRYVLILAVAFYALFGILRPMAQRATALSVATTTAPVGAPARLPTVQEMEGQIDNELGAARQGQPQRLPVLSKRVARLADEEPEQLVRIVRGWMSEEQR